MSDRAFSSAACLLYLENIEIGWATGFRCNENFGLIPVEVMGRLRAVRYEPVSLKYAGSFDYIHMLGNPISKYVSGASIAGGAPRPLWMQGTDKQIVNFEPLTLTVVDLYAQSGPSRVITVVGWMPESRVWSVSYPNLMTENCSFVAIDATEHESTRP